MPDSKYNPDARRVVIVVEGGNIQDVLLHGLDGPDGPPEVTVIDYDAECAEEPLVTKLPQDDKGGVADAVVYEPFNQAYTPDVRPTLPQVIAALRAHDAVRPK